MKALLMPIFLLSATIAVGATAIDRERFSLVLPEGWAEASAVRPVLILDEEDQAAREREFPRFIASTNDCSCVLSFAPQSSRITAGSQSALQMAAFRSGSSVTRESSIKSMGGRDGVGCEMVCRHPYPVISVVRVFSFESDGYVCTLLVTTSDEKEEQAAERMARNTSAVEEIVRSIRIKQQG
jgi:hypothetical protein